MEISSVKPFFRFILFIFVYGVTFLCAQQDTAKVNLISADILEFNKAFNPDYQILKGNVAFEYDGSLLYCDQAKIYVKKDYVVAKNNVHIIINDTTHLYGDSLIIDGTRDLAEMMGNVKLIDKDATLETNHLYYDLKRDVAYYLTGGTITDPESFLKSKKGYYYQKSKDVFFSDSVYIKNKDTEMFSDTLMYNTKTGITYFYGPSQITQPDNILICERGMYDSKEDIGKFSKNVQFYSGTRILKSDSLFYNGSARYSEAFHNVFFRDTTENFILNSHYGRFYEKDSTFLATDSALLKIIENEDTLFLHADSLFMVKDTVMHLQKVLFAFHNARIWRHDFQAVSDSIVYLTNDSIMFMYSNPIMWLDNTQMTGDTIILNYSGGYIDRVLLRNNAFIVSLEKTGDFQQIKSTNMEGVFDENELRTLWARENAETIYFVLDEDRLLIGINKATSEKVKINFVDNQVDNIIFYNMPAGTMNPEEILSESDKFLSGFRWEQSVRPQYAADVFRNPAIDPEAKPLPVMMADSLFNNVPELPIQQNIQPADSASDSRGKNMKGREKTETEKPQNEGMKDRGQAKPVIYVENQPTLHENAPQQTNRKTCFLKRWIEKCRERRKEKKSLSLQFYQRKFLT